MRMVSLKADGWTTVGVVDGEAVGAAEGEVVGIAEGEAVGLAEGEAVGSPGKIPDKIRATGLSAM
jgi:outer membrane lipoprotein SlyB